MKARAVRLAVSFLLIAASLPTDAVAQIRSVKPLAGSPGVLPPMGADPLPAPSFSFPPSALSASVSPTVVAPAAQPQPLSARVQAAQALTRSLANLPACAAPKAAAQSFALLTGEAPILGAGTDAVLSAAAASDPPSLPPPAPRAPNPTAAKNVRRMMLGTAAMKSGMETVTLSVPILALTTLGGASMVAALVVAYGVSQAVFAGAAGSLTDRFPAHTVLAGAVVAQAILVGAIVALGAVSALSAATLLPLYILIGGAVGIAETTRHSIAALILGQDGDALNQYNARLHIAYESAGVAGALAAGALIGLIGPLYSMLIQPPAYVLASYFFLRVRHDKPADAGPASFAARRRVLGKIKEYLGDVKAGAALVLGDGRLRWVALAFVLPQIVHRIFENLLIPVFAKTILHAPQSSAWLLTASNLGELLGAVLLLKFAARFQGPTAWVKYGALGLLLIWTLAATTALPILLPLILASSLSWAASDLSLRSEVQRTIAEKDQPRALSFLYGSFVLGSAAASFALGGLMDALGMGPALPWICGGIAALAAAVFFASRRIKQGSCKL